MRAAERQSLLVSLSSTGANLEHDAM
jgi:hypothetical protein